MRTPEYWSEAKRYLTSVDEKLAEVIHQYEDPPLRSKEDPFLTLCNAVVGQQISAIAAAAIWERATKVVGVWTPAAVDSVAFESLRNCGLSNRKVEYLKGISKDWSSLPHDRFASMTDQSLRKTLCVLRGVGPWSANMLLLFSYLKPDVFPIKDIGVIRAMEQLYGFPRGTPESTFIEYAERWRPYRSVATWYLWRLIDGEAVLY